MEQNVQSIKGVGEAAAKLLKKLGITTVYDLLHYYPRKYDDYSHVLPISKLQPGTVCIKAEIRSVTGRYVRRGMHITEAVASDLTGSVRLTWFNQPYREAAIKKGSMYYIVGDFGLRSQRMAITNPSIEIEHDRTSQLHTARIVPIYKESKGITSQQIRKYIAETLRSFADDIVEIIPGEMLKQHKLLGLQEALMAIHFPKTNKHVQAAKRRLGFDELFVLIAASMLNRAELKGEHALSIPFDETLARKFVKSLPFTLTPGQRKVIWQMYLDMQKDMPMNRLLEGDVGSGKTVVAAMVALMVLSTGYQVALMAPTEILAKQHAETIFNLLTPLGMADSVALLIGATKKKELLKTRLQDGQVTFVVGTHALLTSDVEISKLGLVIIDEQHRFGVEQRKSLQAKSGGHMPHVLHMTATPIPRSLALTVYGELDVSIIDTVPSDRKSIKTSIVSPNSTKQLYKAVDAEIAAGRQAFWVCPLITESSSLKIKPADTVYSTLQAGPFKHRRLALLHGKMKSTEKNKIMKAFLQGQYDMLVTTTVIEVGVDVPNASVMVVENADRFGLAQLHQLRGRVGRSDLQSYCYLLVSDSKQPSRRLRFLEQSNNGFELAEFDLKERGPGAIYGLTQHGVLDLKVADITDVKLIAEARMAVKEFLEIPKNLLQYKEIMARIQRARAITNLN